MKELFRCLALAAIVSALPAWGANFSYVYIPAAACRPYSDCPSCSRGTDTNTGRGYISIPSNSADQTLVCDLTFPFNALGITNGASVTWHTSSTDTTKVACWRASTRFVSSGDTIDELNVDLGNIAWFSGTDQTAASASTNAVLRTDLDNLTAYTQVQLGNGALLPCSLTLGNQAYCGRKPGAFFVQRRGSSNCGTGGFQSVTTPTIFDQVEYEYNTP